jgi:hypothetical protein
MSQSFESLTKTEQDWVQSQLTKASTLVTTYAPEHSADPLSLSALDAAFAGFLARGADADANDAVLAVGVGFGNQLVIELGFQWVVASDQWGTDIAVLARPGRGDVTIFPMDFVAKRYEARESNFLGPSLGAIRKSLEQVATEWGE